MTALAKSDVAIVAAWDSHKTAHSIYADLPFGEVLPLGSYTPEEQAQWDVIDAAELVIQTTTAQTPLGVEIQLWVCLCHSLTDREAEQAARRCDLAYFLADEEQLDWSDRLVLSAIRSLRAMGGAA